MIMKIDSAPDFAAEFAEKIPNKRSHRHCIGLVGSRSHSGWWHSARMRVACGDRPLICRSAAAHHPISGDAIAALTRCPTDVFGLSTGESGSGILRDTAEIPGRWLSQRFLEHRDKGRHGFIAEIGRNLLY